jgi:glutamyl-tRNA synthetase
MDKKIDKVRVRFAPSPTGSLHIGGLRAALFNWLFARHNNGTFLLRIEDTDLERSKPEYTQAILDAFKWVSIKSDEPIVIQSERIERHKSIIDKMLTEGTAYRCFCTPLELQERLGVNAVHQGNYVHYDNKCRTAEFCSKPFVVRFKIPDAIDTVSFDDLIHGLLTFDKSQFDDFIIMRSDGSPTYNFVVVVDDADMDITHVLRGDDHIANTPKQLLLYNACGFATPRFGHLPMILGADGQRLSKRYAATSVLEYRAQGILPDALCNYLIRLGWSHGDQEIFTRQELIEYFGFDHIGKKAAIFDCKKLEWMNSVYLKHSSAERLLEYIEATLKQPLQQKLQQWDRKKIEDSIILYKERVKTVSELIDQIDTFYKVPNYNSDDPEICLWITKSTLEHMELFEKVLENQLDFSIEVLKETIKNFILQYSLSMPAIAKPLRIALTGKVMSPGIFELLNLLGKKESEERIHAFISMLKENLKKH